MMTLEGMTPIFCEKSGVEKEMKGVEYCRRKE